VTNTTYLASVPTSGAGENVKRPGSLSTMKLAELQGLASSLGVTGTAKMRKSDLVAAIKGRQSGASAHHDSRLSDSTPSDSTSSESARADSASSGTARTASTPAASVQSDQTSTGSTSVVAEPASAAQNGQASQSAPAATERPVRTSRRAQRPVGTSPVDEIAAPAAIDQAPPVADSQDRARQESAGDQERPPRQDSRQQSDRDQGGQGDSRQQGGQSDSRQQDNRQQGGQNDRQQGGQSDTRQQGDRQQGGQNDRQQGGQSDSRQQGDRQQGGQSDSRQQGDRQQGGQGDNRQQGDRQQGGRQNNRQQDNRQQGGQNDNRQQGGQNDNRGRYDQDEDSPGGRRRNRQRSRDRKRRGGPGEGSGGQGQNETVEAIQEDDVLVPVAGILEVLDNYAFLRTSGYLPGENDVYVPLGIVKKNDLRKGDAVTGAVRALREGEQIPARQKFNALVRLDTINGLTPEQSLNRVHFAKLTPLYPQERLRLETESNILSTRLIDLIAPIGKGQRGLIVSPAKAGKTLILQAIANAITTNNPEAHLMVVLVDERPEEVTDMQRAVKGEVIASTFDRPATDHTTVAELAIERAKRLVEMGHDVVILLDSITRLGRAYNLAAPASGRILSGGVDSSALYPPKRFFGAARNIENGGSLTILATALVDTGSKMDEVIFEEFKGTGNMELRLSRHLAERRIFPAIDLNPSGTRREEILMANEELKIVWKLRRVISALDQQQGIELLIDRLKKSKSNVEFLMQVQKTSSIQMNEDD
jgi:transcription termination factor Rho